MIFLLLLLIIEPALTPVIAVFGVIIWLNEGELTEEEREEKKKSIEAISFWNDISGGGGPCGG